ncbi:hypothetical protein OMCYN_01831 [cyanobiont of Ornithocercus magnificus]|nr:hypothetical protein OMCYN_01831 [cyanobiont of Ornithocercus magnificus]
MAKHNRPETAKEGTIYLVWYPGSDIHKIGITLNWSRRSTQLGVGTKVRTILVRKVLYPGRLEQGLHSRFRAERIPQSEWFSLSKRQVKLVRQAIETAHKEYGRFSNQLSLLAKFRRLITHRSTQHVSLAHVLPSKADYNHYPGKPQAGITWSHKPRGNVRRHLPLTQKITMTCPLLWYQRLHGNALMITLIVFFLCPTLLFTYAFLTGGDSPTM